MSEQQQVGILLISTRKYKQFVAPLIKQLDEYFLSEHEKRIFVFTDEFQDLESKSSTIVQILIPDYHWPYPTLYRYKIFHENEKELKVCSHLFYLDVDMSVIAKVGNEILVDEGLGIVRHPGFYRGGWGDNNNPIESTSYMPKEHRKAYYCGGTQFGTSSAYLEMSRVLDNNIDIDEKKGIRSEWNEETHYNKYVNENKDGIKLTEFNPSYCMPEPISLRVAWGIQDLTPLILALDKNHSEIRS